MNNHNYTNIKYVGATCLRYVLLPLMLAPVMTEKLLSGVAVTSLATTTVPMWSRIGWRPSRMTRDSPNLSFRY